MPDWLKLTPEAGREILVKRFAADSLQSALAIADQIGVTLKPQSVDVSLNVHPAGVTVTLNAESPGLVGAEYEQIARDIDTALNPPKK
jgi:hypothetical protein